MKTSTNLIVAIFAIMCLSSCVDSNTEPQITNPRNDATIMLKRYKERKGSSDELEWAEDLEKMMNMYIERGDYEGAKEFHSLVVKGL